MPFKQLQLLLSVLDAAENVPLQLAESLTYYGMQLHGRLIPNLFLEVIQDLRNERHECILKDLGGHSELLELFLHLAQVHVIVDLSQLVEKHVHPLIVRDVGRHEALQLLRSLLLGVHLCELLQRLQQILLKFRDIGTNERLRADNRRLAST